jgi:hypothetical protein
VSFHSNSARRTRSKPGVGGVGGVGVGIDAGNDGGIDWFCDFSGCSVCVCGIEAAAVLLSLSSCSRSATASPQLWANTDTNVDVDV